MEAFATLFREKVKERRLRSIEYSKSIKDYPSATIPQEAGKTERQWTDSTLILACNFISNRLRKLGEGKAELLETRKLKETRNNSPYPEAH